MTAHDPHCPITTTALLDCPICALLKAARDDERDTYQRVWKENLPRISARNYANGHRAALEGRPLPEWVEQGTTELRRA